MRRTLGYLQLRLLDLSRGGGHLVLQEGQLCVGGAAADTASALLQVSQGAFQPIHGPRGQVHLYKQGRVSRQDLGNMERRQV